jgi:hypothetical protein
MVNANNLRIHRPCRLHLAHSQFMVPARWASPVLRYDVGTLTLISAETVDPWPATDAGQGR